MTVASEITRLQSAKANIKTAIENKWVEVPSSAKLDVYDEYINQIHQGSDFSWTARYVAVLDTNIPDASRLSSSLSWWILWYKGWKWLCHWSTWWWYYIWICSYWWTWYDYWYFDSRYTLVRQWRNDPLTGRLYLETSYNWWWWDIIEATELVNSWYWYNSSTKISRNDGSIIGVLNWQLVYNYYWYANYFQLAWPTTKWDYDWAYENKAWISIRTDSNWIINLPYLKNWVLNYYHWSVYSYQSSTAKDIALYNIDDDYNKSTESLWTLNVTWWYTPWYTSLDWVVLISDWANTYVSTEEWVGAATWYIINTDGTNFTPWNVYWCEETWTYCSDRYKLVPIEDYIQQQWLPIRRKI